MSKDTVSRITDAIVADTQAWQSRPLDAIYAVVLIDAIVVAAAGSCLRRAGTPGGDRVGQ